MNRALQPMPLVEWVDTQAAKARLEEAQRTYSSARWKYYSAFPGKKKLRLKAFQEATNALLRAELEYDKQMRKIKKEDAS